MLGIVLLFAALFAQREPHVKPPQILLIVREPIRPGALDAYSKIEEEIAKGSASLGCPHPYLALQPLDGASEVWWLNGFVSQAEVTQVGDTYSQKTAFSAMLKPNQDRKAQLAGTPVEVYANYRRDLSRQSWSLGQGRFLVITVTSGDSPAQGSVYEAADGRRFVVRSARTRAEAESIARAAGQGTTVLAVKPGWSFPAKEWVASDPEFWRGAVEK